MKSCFLLLLFTWCFASTVYAQPPAQLNPRQWSNIQQLSGMKRDKWPPAPEDHLLHSTVIAGDINSFRKSNSRSAIFLGDKPLHVPNGRAAVITQIEIIGGNSFITRPR